VTQDRESFSKLAHALQDTGLAALKAIDAKDIEALNNAGDERGEPAGPERRLTNQADRAYEADIAANGDNLAVAWYEVSPNRTSHAMIGVWTPDGQRLWSRPLAPPERISRNPVVRTVGQEIFVAWVAENAARDFEVYAAWFDRKGNLLAVPQDSVPRDRRGGM
jgi:hypothetical protein